MTDELRRKLDRIAADAPGPDEGRDRTLRAAKRRSRVGMAMASGVTVAAIAVSAVAVGAVLNRRSLPPVGPTHTGTVTVPTPSPTPSPKPEGTLAFLRGGSIVTIRADGSAQTTLAQVNGQSSRLAWSQQGTFVFDHIVSEASGSIETMGPDGGNRERILGLGRPSSPDWSPDGRRVAFVTDSGALFTMSAGGSDPRAVRRALTGEHPSWAPDGKRLAFITTAGDVAIVAVAGGGEPQIIASEGEASSLDWGPEGTIAFSSTLGGERFLYLVGADGRDLRALISAPGVYADPAWSPDGAFVAYVDIVQGRQDVFVVSADGTSTVRLTDDGSQEISPVWRPLS